jgi:FMN phosphatase YigB (HAD superfamily)
MNTILFTDLDNTLYNWVDYFGPSFRAMIHALAPKFNMTEDVFFEELKEIYKRKGTLEYLPVLQELPVFKQLSDSKKKDYIKLATIAFGRARNKNLSAYSSVVSTLKNLQQSGVIIIAVTNAPSYFGEYRLKKLAIDKYFYGIPAWEGKEMPQGFKVEKRYSKHINHRWQFTKDEIKPNPFAYLRIISDLKISHKTTYVVGDSISKDLNPAKEIGAKTIWAKYGTEFDKKNFDTLLRITHWESDDVQSTYNEKPIEPDYIIDSFSELNEIIETPQLKLF